MAAIIQRRGIYYAQFFDRTRTPQRKRISLKTTRKDHARRRLAKLEHDAERGRFDPWTDDPDTYDKPQPKPTKPSTLQEAQDAFLTRKRRDGRSENTLRTYREIISLFADAAGAATQLRDLSPDALNAFIRAEGVSKATQHKRFGHLRTFLRWCIKHDLLEENPLDAVEPPQKPHKLPKAVTRGELAMICDALRGDYQEKLAAGLVQEGEMIWRIPLFRFAFYTGMRASELARLRWRDVDFEKRLIYIRKQKNRKEQTIPLNRRAADVLRDVPHGYQDDYVFRSPRFTGTQRANRNFAERASEAFRRARKDAGITRPISFHGLRHGFCTALAEAGKSAPIIKEAARHADISTTMRYVHIANERLKAELDDVFG